MLDEDLYEILGVLPDAEDVVVTAAFRALAQRYHPDRWIGDIEDAHRRMSEINHAYSILGNSSKRREYDQRRGSQRHANLNSENAHDQAEAFSSALDDANERWEIACGIFPDLVSLKSELGKISSSLAFAFVSGLLENKSFPKRVELAICLERAFFERYFGENQKIQKYARALIAANQRAAAKALNRLVEVLGPDVDPQLLIERLDKEFDLHIIWDREIKKQAINNLIRRVSRYRNFHDAAELARLMEYSIVETKKRLFFERKVILTTPQGETMKFDSHSAFVDWTRMTLCDRWV